MNKLTNLEGETQRLIGVPESVSPPKCQTTTPICKNCENDPTEPPKSSLNGENQHLTGAPTEDS
jgi:hypothetical protein